jgi:hypothetical protein
VERVHAALANMAVCEEIPNYQAAYYQNSLKIRGKSRELTCILDKKSKI